MKSACNPTGPLNPIPIQMETPCIECGTTLYRKWSRDGTDFYWVDGDGRFIGGRPPAGFNNGYEVLNHLSRPSASAREMAAYSSMLAATSLGSLWPWEHPHRPTDPEPHGKPVPECHLWPMQATRDGWRCRIDRKIFPYREES